MNKIYLEAFKCMIIFFELYIFTQMYHSYFEKKQITLRLYVFSKIACYIILCFINIFSQNAIQLSLFSFIVYIVFAYILYLGKIWKIFFLTLILWCFGIASEFMAFAVGALVSKKEFLDIVILEGGLLWIITAIISKLFILIFIKIITKFHSTDININKIPFKYWTGMMCIPVLSTILLFFSLDFFMKLDNIPVEFICLFSVLILFINTTVFSIFEEVYRQADDKVENLMLKQQLIAQLEHYNQLKVNDEKIITIIHDTKNTLFCLEKMLEQKQYDSAIIHIRKTLGKISENYNVIKYIDNPVVDAFLNDKFLIAKSSGIKVNVNIDKMSELKLNIIDLCLIFGNALDNAIEACNKKNECDLAYINIKVLTSSTNLKIEISNSVFENINENNGKIYTNKKNIDLHGYGLKNIQKIIEKYNGNMGIKIQGNTFVFGAIIPNTKVF